MRGNGYLEDKCMLNFARLLNFYKVQLYIPYVHAMFLATVVTFSLHLYLFSWLIIAFSDVCFWKCIINWIINLARMYVCNAGSQDGSSLLAWCVFQGLKSGGQAWCRPLQAEPSHRSTLCVCLPWWLWCLLSFHVSNLLYFAEVPSNSLLGFELWLFFLIELYYFFYIF